MKTTGSKQKLTGIKAKKTRSKIQNKNGKVLKRFLKRQQTISGHKKKEVKSWIKANSWKIEDRIVIKRKVDKASKQANLKNDKREWANDIAKATRTLYNDRSKRIDMVKGKKDEVRKRRQEHLMQVLNVTDLEMTAKVMKDDDINEEIE